MTVAGILARDYNVKLGNTDTQHETRLRELYDSCYEYYKPDEDVVSEVFNFIFSAVKLKNPEKEKIRNTRSMALMRMNTAFARYACQNKQNLSSESVSAMQAAGYPFHLPWDGSEWGGSSSNTSSDFPARVGPYM